MALRGLVLDQFVNILSKNLKIKTEGCRRCSSTCLNLKNKISVTLTPGFRSYRYRDRLLQDYRKTIKRDFCANSKSESLLSLDAESFVKFMKKENISRCMIYFDDATQKVNISHPQIEEIGDRLRSGELNYDSHEGIFLAPGARTQCLLAAFIWNTNRGQACGGITIRYHKNISELLQDGNKSSKTLGIKAALAGLWAGGGKGMISVPAGNKYIDPKFREDVFLDYGEFLTSLNGCLLSGTTLGSSVSDITNVYSRSRYAHSVDESIGGSGSASKYTAKGVVCAMEAAIDFLQLGSLQGKTVVLQGAGNVGTVLIEELLKQDVRHIYATDTNQMRVQDVKDMFEKQARGRLTLLKVPFGDRNIYRQPCDIFSPCATPKVLTRETIPLMDTRIICGAANHQTEEDSDNSLMLERNITFVTDFVPNRMAMVRRVMEPYGRLPGDPELMKHLSKDWEHSIYNTTLRILKLAEKEKIPPVSAAYRLGKDRTKDLHPLFPYRCKKIMQGLIATEWHNGVEYLKHSRVISECTGHT
ncbi:hypothetical protein CHS0354_016135 [Potamilus streckersoni]|uniref:Glutamate/phenylalanine/leucine/valine/L-tryptophan dehydrogenase C-terminal domain-containing protein n=1 Tax=Potamilus streckersoni TaxID=2493646 RepID=A0AAE0W512_9BIVA|nr:hypothetical protein CHS0354_016135 [Potamilus streckersoni]